MADSFRPASRKKPKYCSRVLAVCPDGRIFLIKKRQGHFELPGGGEEKKDEGNPALVVLRELGEETGVYLIDEPKIPRLREISRIRRNDEHIWICYILYITQEELEMYRPESDEGEAHLFKPETILSMGYRWWGFPEEQYNIVADYYLERYF